MLDSTQPPLAPVPADGRQVTREQLYDEVWREPMLKLGLRHGVSSSFLARVCSELNVPRPPRGYWAKLEFGKDAGRPPPLPEACAEDKLVWNRTHDADIVRRPVPKPPSAARKARSPMPQVRPKVHPLIVGARELFTKGRKTETGLLKPNKKLLVDLVVTEALLEEMLAVANSLFQRLEAEGHRVVIAPADRKYRRLEVDERVVPKKERFRYGAPSSPYRPTIVVIGTVAIGLTIFEMTEVLETQYMGNNQYVPVKLLTEEQRRRAARLNHWTSQKDYATGRMCLQAYSPYGVASWVTHWRESQPKELEKKLDAIVKALERAAGDVARLVEEGEREAEVERLKRAEDWRRLEAKWERKRRAKAEADSRADLLKAIDAWAEVKRIQAFFSDAEIESRQIATQDRSEIFERIRLARELIGDVDALSVLRTWKPPSEH